MNSSKLSLHYASIQIFHWGAYAAIWGFIALLLSSYGFRGTQIGVLTSTATLLAVIVAPAVSALIDRSVGLSDRHGASALTALALLLALIVHLSGIRARLPVAIAFVLIGAALSSAPPFHNAMAMAAERRGFSINYGVCRGCGSVAYAIAALGLGFLLDTHGAAILLPLFCVLDAALTLASISFRLPGRPGVDDASGTPPQSTPALLRANPRFVLTLLGCMFFIAGHVIPNTYVNSIVERVGGSPHAMGLVLAISAAAELPAMALVSRMRRKISCGLLLRISAAAAMIKYLIFLFAPSIAAVYFAAALQFFQFGFYLPATVYYVAQTLAPGDQLKGQSLIHVAGSGLGAAIGGAAGGVLLDIGGIRLSLLFALLCALAALVTFTLSTRNNR